MSLRNYIYHLLRKGETVTGTDNIYLAKGGFWLTFGQGLGSAASLALAILFGRFVSKDAYGTYQYLAAVGSVVSILSLTGMSDALTQAVARGYDRTIYRVLRRRLLCSIAGLVFAAIISAWYFWHNNIQLGIGIVEVGLFFPVTAALSAWGDYLIGKKQFGLQTRLYLVGTLASPAMLIAAIFLVPKPLAFITAFCLVWVATHGIALAYTLKKIPPKGGDDPGVEKYGLKLTGIDILANFATYFDRLVIFWLLGSKETAAYAFAIAPVEQIKGYLKNLYVLALPKISARPVQEIRKTFFRKFGLMTGLVVAGIALYVALAPFLYHLLFPVYPEAVRLTQVYAIGLVGTALALIVAVFNGHKHTKENLWLQVSSSAIGIVLLIILVPRYGLMGAVLARVVTRLVGLLIGIVLVKKVFDEPTSITK